MKKCPNCDFELEENQTTCPNCGFEKPDETTVVSEETNHSTEKTANDNIQWSELHDVPLGSVIEQFSELQEEAEEALLAENSEETNDLSNKLEDTEAAELEEPEQSVEPVNDLLEEDTKEAFLLAEYIRRHKNPDEVFEETFEEVVAAVQASDQVSDQTEMNEESTDSSDLVAEETQVEESVNETQEPTEDVESNVSETTEVDAVEEVASVAAIEEQLVSEPEVFISEADANPKPEETVETAEETTVEEAPSIPAEAVEPVTVTSTEALEAAAETRSTQPNDKPKKRKKTPYLITAAVIVLAGGGWFYYDHQQKVEAERQEQLRIEKAVDGIETQLLSFYVDDNRQFIAPSKTEEDLTTTLSELDQYSNEEKYSTLVAEGQVIKDKLALIDRVNQFFTAPIIVGDQLQKDVHIKPDSIIDVAALKTNDAFSQLVNQAIQQGQAESKSLQAANKAVKSLLAGYQKGKLSDAVSRKDVESTKQMVTDLFASDKKEQLLKDVATVEKALVAREKAQKAAEQAAAEEQARQERAAAEERARQQQNAQTNPTYNEGQEILSPSTPKNKLNQPIISTRQSDLNDTNNPAWDWAPGVYNQVIQTAIQRGYIVEGGYKLERVRIENGEGYYNLYATNTQSSLMKGIGESALPMYLFTINDKTGYFRGNGND
jgi:hypothetical protein